MSKIKISLISQVFPFSLHLYLLCLFNNFLLFNYLLHYYHVTAKGNRLALELGWTEPWSSLYGAISKLDRGS